MGPVDAAGPVYIGGCLCKLPKVAHWSIQMHPYISHILCYHIPFRWRCINVWLNVQKWLLASRQRSWTGLTQFRPGQDSSLPPKAIFPSTHIGSIRVPGRKKCPDINMVDDLPFRMSTHAHSLPPTPNPYAVPSLIDRTEAAEKSLVYQFFQDEKPISLGNCILDTFGWYFNIWQYDSTL